MDEILRNIIRTENLGPGDAQIEKLTGGQVNQVFLVDQKYVVRIGQRENAFYRLQHETELLRSLEGMVRVPRVIAFGKEQGYTYQVQLFVPGQKVYAVWKDLRPFEQERIVVELTESLRILHGLHFPSFGWNCQEDESFDTWSGFLTNKFQRAIAEIQSLRLAMVPGSIEMAEAYFEEHKGVLEGGVPSLVHCDLTLVNLLAHQGKLSAILDFEYSIRAPRDYELWVLEAFCLYPNDYAEAHMEIFCSADFANFCVLVRKHYPELFETPNLRERLNLYQLDAALGSYVGWRKANLSTIPPERMAGKDFYMARITNFVFRAGARMFFS
jgi:aminoglycoside phosphotransferase (APT) family kinase protein